MLLLEQKIYTAEFNNMHKIYFLKLWKKNKFLFLAVFLFFLINIVANLFIVTQITPIYNWSLYSAPIENQQTYSFLKVIYNDNKVLRFKHTWEDPRKFLLTNTMKLFVALQVKKENDPVKQYYKDNWLPRHPNFNKIFKEFKNYNDEKELNKFPLWYKRYLQQKVEETVYKIDVYEIQVEFLKDRSVRELSSKIIFSYNEQ